MKSQQSFSSPYLNVSSDEDGTEEYFLFCSGTPRDEIIETLERYLSFTGATKAYTYELIGSVLNDNSFRECHEANLSKTFYVSVDLISVSP